MTSRFRLALFVASTVAFAACSDAPTMPNSGAAAFAKTPAPSPTPAPTPTPTPAPAVSLTGHWVDGQILHFVLPDGTAQEVWYEFDAVQKGTKLTGIARRYVSYFDVTGVAIVVRRDLGAPGDLTGTVNGNDVSIGFIKITESKLNLGWQTTLSADGNTLTVNVPTEFGVRRWVRG
jgi:hypothetical protein